MQDDLVIAFIGNESLDVVRQEFVLSVHPTFLSPSSGSSSPVHFFENTPPQFQPGGWDGPDNHITLFSWL